MKLHTDHLAYLIHLESGLNTEFFSALSATNKKLVLDLAEAKLVIVNDANQVVVAAHTNALFKHVTNAMNVMNDKILNDISWMETKDGQTKQS